MLAKFRRAFICCLAVILFLFFIRLSSYASQLILLTTNSLTPAISAVTTNTNTTHGLTPTIYNLSFLFHAALTSIFFFFGAASFRKEELKLFAKISLVYLFLSFITSINFWPREQLIQLWVQGLICFFVLTVGAFQTYLLKVFLSQHSIKWIAYLVMALTIFLAVILPGLYGTLAFFLHAGLLRSVYLLEAQLTLASALASIIVTWLLLKEQKPKAIAE